MGITSSKTKHGKMRLILRDLEQRGIIAFYGLEFGLYGKGSKKVEAKASKKAVTIEKKAKAPKRLRKQSEASAVRIDGSSLENGQITAPEPSIAPQPNAPAVRIVVNEPETYVTDAGLIIKESEDGKEVDLGEIDSASEFRVEDEENEEDESVESAYAESDDEDNNEHDKDVGESEEECIDPLPRQPARLPIVVVLVRPYVLGPGRFF